MNKAKKIVSVLQNNGFEAVFAGGCVRDSLLQLIPKDIDIATSATPNEVESLFKNTIPVGKQFGIIIVVIDGEEFEVATFRTDSKSSDGRRPNSVEFSSMEEDAKRRDLTINSVFFDPIKEKLYDFVGGKKDLESGLIRFVGHSVDRIEEDKLRILRAVRFAAKFNFDFEEETMKSLLFNSHRVMGNVSAERIKDELDKMLLIKKPSIAFNIMKDLGILKFILPEIDRLDYIPQSKKWHSEGNVWVHTMMVLDEARIMTDDLGVLWAALLHDVAKPHTMLIKNDGSISNHGHEKKGMYIWVQDIARRFKVSNKEEYKVAWLIENHMKPNIALDMKKSTLYKLISEEFFDELIILCKADNASSFPADPEREDKKEAGVIFLDSLKYTLEATNEHKLPKPLLTGKDLINLGLKPGPQFREILDEVFDLQLEGSFSDKNAALDYVNLKL